MLVAGNEAGVRHDVVLCRLSPRSGTFQPGGPSTNPQTVPYNGGGLLLWNDNDNFIRLERAAFLRQGQIRTFVAFQQRAPGARGAVHTVVVPAGSCYLRLERQGNRLLGAVSTDSVTWQQMNPIDVLWPANLTVGLAAINTSARPFVVQFEEFTLETKRGEKGARE